MAHLPCLLTCAPSTGSRRAIPFTSWILTASLLTPMAPLVPELAREIERLRVGAGLGTQELLAGLRKQHGKYRAGAQPDVTER